MDILQISNDSGEFLQMMINNLLDHSKLQAGKLAVVTRSIQVRKFVKKILKMFKVKAKEKKLQLHLKVSSALPQIILMDEQKVCQIIVNLVSNSIKFTDKGSVTVEVEWIPETSIKL
jgi:signal transduction histidine kinase